MKRGLEDRTFAERGSAAILQLGNGMRKIRLCRGVKLNESALVATRTQHESLVALLCVKVLAEPASLDSRHSIDPSRQSGNRKLAIPLHGVARCHLRTALWADSVFGRHVKTTLGRTDRQSQDLQGGRWPPRVDPTNSVCGRCSLQEYSSPPGKYWHRCAPTPYCKANGHLERALQGAGAI